MSVLLRNIHTPPPQSGNIGKLHALAASQNSARPHKRMCLPFIKMMTNVFCYSTNPLAFF
jgi:hypothetical protein